MSDEERSISRRSALKATASAAAATITMAGTAAAQSSTTDVSVGDRLRVPRYVIVYESCTSDQGYLIRTEAIATIESICRNGRIGVSFEDASLDDGYVESTYL